MSDTLLLDQNYLPLDQIGWERTMTMLFCEKIEIVAEYADRVIRTVSRTFKLPSVVRLLTGSAGRRKAVRFSKQNLYARDKGRCQYCSVKVTQREATIDHVTPKAQGGVTRWESVVIACLSCNHRKGNRTPQQANMRLLSKPVRPAHLPETLRITLAKGAVPFDWRVYLMSPD